MMKATPEESLLAMVKISQLMDAVTTLFTTLDILFIFLVFLIYAKIITLSMIPALSLSIMLSSGLVIGGNFIKKYFLLLPMLNFLNLNDYSVFRTLLSTSELSLVIDKFRMHPQSTHPHPDIDNEYLRRNITALPEYNYKIIPFVILFLLASFFIT